MPDYERILITGAAGSLGRRLRLGLAPLATRIRLVDVKDLGPAAANEEVVVADLADRDTAIELTRDCDAIVHFAGHPREITFDELMADVLPGAYHMYEGARRHGARRVVYASSIHAVGFAPVEDVPDTRVMHRPDTFYGLSKTFVEDLASLYWDKFGVESVCLRICSCFDECIHAFGCDHVAREDGQVLPCAFDAANGFEHTSGMSVRGVDGDHIHACFEH